MATPGRALLLVSAMQVITAAQMIAALLSPQRIRWRGKVMRVERGGAFTYEPLGTHDMSGRSSS